jgi:hypothetical protein
MDGGVVGIGRAWLAGTLLAGTALAAEVSRHTVVLSGQTAGEQIVERTADGELRIEFAFNDRGRGPRLVETLRLDSAGIPVAVEIEGHDYLQNPVSERFAREPAGSARWVSSVESGEREEGSGFYASFHGAPYELALLARALERAPGRRLELLPVGEATLEEVGTLSVGEGASARTVRHLAVHGLGFAPTPLWLDADGELFSIASAWFSVVRAGGKERSIASSQRSVPPPPPAGDGSRGRSPTGPRARSRCAARASSIPRRSKSTQGRRCSSTGSASSRSDRTAKSSCPRTRRSSTPGE